MWKRCSPAFSPEGEHGFHRTCSAVKAGRGKVSFLSVTSTRCKKDFRSDWRSEKHWLQGSKLMGHFSLTSLGPQQTTPAPNAEQHWCKWAHWVQSTLAFRGAERSVPASPVTNEVSEGRQEGGEKPSLQHWFSFGFSFSTSLWPMAYKKRVKLPRRISYVQQFQIPLATGKTRTTPLPLPKRKGRTYTKTGMKISWLFILSCWIGKHNYYNSLDTAQLLAQLPCSPPHSPSPQFLFGTCSNQIKHICKGVLCWWEGVHVAAHLLHTPLITPNQLIYLSNSKWAKLYSQPEQSGFTRFDEILQV